MPKKRLIRLSSLAAAILIASPSFAAADVPAANRALSEVNSAWHVSDALNDVPSSLPAESDATFTPEIQALAKDQGISDAEARGRLIWQRQVSLFIEDAQQSAPDTFGGAWIDGHSIKTWMKSSKAAFGAKLASSALIKGLVDSAAKYNFSDDIVPLDARYSQAELLAVQSLIDNSLAIANRGAAVSVDVEPDVKNNRLQLEVPSNATHTQADLVARLRASYGQMLSATTKPDAGERFACDGPWCDPPLRGGIGVVYLPANNMCTAGFVVVSLSDANPYLSTAGHCIYENNETGTWSTAFSNDVYHDIGSPHNWTNDIAILNINNQTGWGAGPYIRTQANNQYTIQGKTVPAVGARICEAGGNSWGQDTCGTVTYGLATRSGTPNTMRSEGTCMNAGDSGAPMFSYGIAMGSAIGYYGSGTCPGWFVAISYIGMNVTVLQG